MREEIHLCDAAGIHNPTTDDFFLPKKNQRWHETRHFKDKRRAVPVPHRIEIPTEIQQVKKRRSHSDWWHFHWSDGKQKKQGIKQNTGIIRDSVCSALCDVYLS